MWWLAKVVNVTGVRVHGLEMNDPTLACLVRLLVSVALSYVGAYMNRSNLLTCLFAYRTVLLLLGCGSEGFKCLISCYLMS